MATSKTLKKILTPTDFSSASEHGVDYAARLASMLQSELILFHVNEAPSLMPAEPVVFLDYTFIGAEIKRDLEKLKESIANRYQLKRIHSLSVPGFVVDEIKAETEQENVDLVVMGADDTSLFTESVSQSVIDRVNCPVLSVPSGAIVKKPQLIAFVTDYQYHDIRILRYLSSVLEPLNARIAIIYCQEDLESPDADLIREFYDQARNAVGEERVDFHSVGSVTGGEDSLEMILPRLGADWCSTVLKRRSIINRIAAKSPLKDLSMHLNIPFLAFQDS